MPCAANLSKFRGKGMTHRRSVGLVGVGYWGKNLARNFHQLGALHTICDADIGLLEARLAELPGVEVTTDFDQMLANPEITRIAIAVPAEVHYPLAKKALLAGKDVYVEKPLCLDRAEGEELIRLAEERGQILMVGHLLQYHPYMRKLQEMVGAGELGKLHYIVSNRLNLGKIRKEENALWSLAPHDISVILSLLGHKLPEKVRCIGGAFLTDGVADVSMTTLTFADNIRAHIYVSWLHPFKEQKLTVIGSKAMAVFDDTLPWEEKLVLYRDHLSWEGGSVPVPSKGDGERIVVPKEEPLRLECDHFLRCCDERVAPRTDGQEGLRVLQVLQAAQVSLAADGEEMAPVEVHPLRYSAHSTAVVDSGAEIGDGTKIWHFSHIMEGAKIGARCNLGQNVVVSPQVTLGSNVKVQNNVSLYSGVVCEDDVFIGPSAVFTNIPNPRSAVVRRDLYRRTVVRRGATIGANATILCGIELGEYSFVGAGAVVTKSIPAYALVVGSPARHVGWMSRHGGRLDLPLFLPDGGRQLAACPESGEVYCLEGDRLVYLGNVDQKIEIRERETVLAGR
jgi:UDP-2-acetamido-3-amino-2,3-dideoxy-glucuronate N-acetyltransferase